MIDLDAILKQRSQSKCELCSAAGELKVYSLVPGQQSADTSVIVCGTCWTFIQNQEPSDENHWRCLAESMWSEFVPVQALSWRLLKRLETISWAQDLLNQMYLDDDVLLWAAEAVVSDDAANDETHTRDSNGAVLSDGDAVTLIKDLEVKGANFTAKRGTTVKNISLTSNPEHIEGRVNGTQIVILTRFVKKA